MPNYEIPGSGRIKVYIVPSEILSTSYKFRKITERMITVMSNTCSDLKYWLTGEEQVLKGKESELAKRLDIRIGDT